MIRVAVVDDQALVRAGFVVLLRSAPGITVVGEAGTGSGAVLLARAEHPDVMLMDVRMPDLNGIEAARRIVADPSTASTRILILTTFDLDEYVYEGLRAGASGFLLKDTQPQALIDAVRIIAEGEALLAPSTTRRLIAEFVRQGPAAPAASGTELDTLTGREREVLLEVARGRSNTEISDRLFMSYATAKTHVSRLLTKLGARDRTQLVVVAYESGLVQAASAQRVSRTTGFPEDGP